MTTFTYDNTVPATANNPSIDQPNMLINTQSAASIWDEDHVGFNAANGGQHLQVTLESQNVPGAISGDAGVVYTDAGVEDTNAYLNFKNPTGVFPLSGVRAFGSFALIATIGVNPVTAINEFNVDSISANVATSTATYTINLTANAVTGTSAVVIPFLNLGTLTGTVSYSLTADTLTVTTTGSAGVIAGRIFSFVIFQA